MRDRIKRAFTTRSRFEIESPAVFVWVFLIWVTTMAVTGMIGYARLFVESCR